MAGEKLSARQKMIGMMYLVLTALLALQISNTVLEKFININKNLEKSIARQVQKNKKKLYSIEKIVKESGERKEDVLILNKAKGIKKETNKIVTFINDLKTTLINLNGGIDKKTKNIKNIKNDSHVANLMINKKKGYELQKKLNNYTVYLSKKTNTKYQKFALDAKDCDLYRNDPNQRSKDFTILNFDKTPLSAALATLSQFCSNIILQEANALDYLAHKVGAADLKFDNIVPMIKPKSNIVAAGTPYQADLFLTASSSSKPLMHINGKKIQVENGFGKISFITSPGEYNEEGIAKKKFQSTITIKLPSGQDSTFVQTVEYFVAKPIIQIQSAAVQALYLNCGNELNIQVPALGKDYNPKFTATGASIIQGSGQGLLTVVPTSPNVKINVYNNSIILGTQEFKVRTIPKPTILITSRQKPINEKRGMPSPGPRSLTFTAVPDPSFKTFLPKDARYRVVAGEIILARGSRPIKVKKIHTSNINLSDFSTLARPGDRIVIEIKKVERLNFKNNIEEVNMGSIVHTIPLN